MSHSNNDHHDDLFDDPTEHEAVIIFGSDQDITNNLRSRRNTKEQDEIHDHEDRKSSMAWHDEMDDNSLDDDMYIRYHDDFQNRHKNIEEEMKSRTSNKKKLHNELLRIFANYNLINYDYCCSATNLIWISYTQSTAICG